MIFPRALYFPFNDILPDRLARALVFFEAIILYRLPENQLEDGQEKALEDNLLDLREAGFIEDKKKLNSIIADFKNWVQAGDLGHLAALTRHRQEAEKKESPTSISSSVRGFGNDSEDLDAAANEEAQLFLHFAAFLDRQKNEIDSLMDSASEKELDMLQSLHDEEGQLSEALDSTGFESEKAPGLEAVDFPDKRMDAWGRLHNEFGNDSDILFTDQPDIIDYLDLALTKKLGAINTDENAEREALLPIFNFKISYSSDLEVLSEVTKIREELQSQAGSGLAELLGQLNKAAWNKIEAENLISSFKKLPAEITIPAAQTAPAANRLSLTGYLVPGENIKQAFRVIAGHEPAPEFSGNYCGPVFEVSLEPV